MGVGVDAARWSRALVARAARHRSHHRPGHRRPVPQGVPPRRPAVSTARDAGPDDRGDPHARARRRDGTRRRLALRRVVVRRVPPAPLPALHHREQSSGAARRRRGRGRRRHLQGPGDGRDLRPRGPVQGGSGPPCAAAGTGVVGRGVPRVRLGQRHDAAVRGARLAAPALLRRSRRRARRWESRPGSVPAASRGWCWWRRRSPNASARGHASSPPV